MAERRMFAKSIVLSDAFLDMPLGARCLYMTMGMMADDDGFVNNAKSIIRITGASEDDLRVLISKKFILPFDDGVIVIKHWRINNYLRNDRYQETKYIEDKARLLIDKKGAYTYIDDGIPSSGIPSIGKDSIGKDSIDKVSNYRDTDIIDNTNSYVICNNTPLPPQRGKGAERTDEMISLLDQAGFSEKLLAALHEWLQYKKEIKKPYKSIRGFEQFLAIVKRHQQAYSDDAICDVIFESMSNGYQGVVWDRLSKGSSRPNKAKELDDFYKMANDWANKED